jgi:hypothetical protein
MNSTAIARNPAKVTSFAGGETIVRHVPMNVGVAGDFFR